MSIKTVDGIGPFVNLSDSNSSDWDLRGLNLSNANLSGSNLENTTFYDADLMVDLSNANISYSRFKSRSDGSQLTNSDLTTQV